MASSVAPTSTHAASQPVTTVASAQSKKFLDYCVEQLDPTVASAFERQSTLWKIAGKATVAFYIGLAAATFFATGILAPTYAPIAGIVAVLLLGPVAQFYDRFDRYAAQAKVRGGQLKEINRHYEDLTGKTPVQLQTTLFRMGVTWFQIPGMLQNPENLKTLNPLIARHQFWEGHIQALEERKQALLQKAQAATAAGKRDLYNLHGAALDFERRILESKVKDAFSIAAMRRPTLTGPLDNLGDFSTLSQQERVIGNAVGDRSVNNLFTFKNNAFAALTADEVKRTEAVDLSQRILAAASA